MRVAVELAEQCIAILRGPVGQLLDEVLNLFPAGLAECLGAAEVDGKGLDQLRIELVLADDLAQPVADFYREFMDALASLEIEVKIWKMPVESW